MTIQKMQRVLERIGKHHGTIECSGSSELCIILSGQPARSDHDWLLTHGFIYLNGTYIYRPRAL